MCDHWYLQFIFFFLCFPRNTSFQLTDFEDFIFFSRTLYPLQLMPSDCHLTAPPQPAPLSLRTVSCFPSPNLEISMGIVSCPLSKDSFSGQGPQCAGCLPICFGYSAEALLCFNILTSDNGLENYSK